MYCDLRKLAKTGDLARTSSCAAKILASRPTTSVTMGELFPDGSTRVCAEVAIEGLRRDVVDVDGRRLETPESLMDIDADGGLLDFVVVWETLAFLDRPNILIAIFSILFLLVLLPFLSSFRETKPGVIVRSRETCMSVRAWGGRNETRHPTKNETMHRKLK